MVGNNSNLEIFNRIKETNSNNADEYSNSKTYVKDEYCIYNNTLYKAKQAIDTAEEFTESHWTETTVGTELKSQADSISSLNSSLPESIYRLRSNAVCDSSYSISDLVQDCIDKGTGLYFFQFNADAPDIPAYISGTGICNVYNAQYYTVTLYPFTFGRIYQKYTTGEWAIFSGTTG